MPAEFDIAAALRESEEMLKNIGAKPAPETPAGQSQAESDPGLLNKDWGWQAGLESALGIEQKPTTVAAALNEVGFGNLNEQQKAIADSVEDPEEISKFPAWHEKTPRQKEIAYEYSKRPITMSDVGAGVKGALAGFGGLSEGLLKGVGKIARDFTPDPEIYSATPERAKELSEEQGKRQLNALRSYAEAFTDLGQEVGHLYHKGTTAGFSNVDRILSNLGMSEERRREKWMARDALEMENARKALANPSSLGTFSKETLKAVLSFNGPSVEEILYLHPEFKGDIEKAKAFKEKQVEDRASEALSGYLQWLKDVPADPDIKTVAALTPLPGVGAANLWSLGEKTLKGALELGSVTRRLASGMTAEQWAASQAAKGREALAKSAEAASKMGPVGRGAERVANIIDDSGQKILTGLGNIPGAKTLGEALERTSEFLEEAGVPQQLQQGAKSLGGKVVTGATIGSFLDEDTVKGAALGAGLGAVALGAPRFVADLSRASARNAKGITGTFGALAQDPTRGWMSRLATVRPEAVDWIAGHMADFTKSGVHATPMAITLGLMDSDDPQGFVKSMMEGWAWAAGPQLIHKALGKDPVQMQRERSKYDHQVYKLKSSMSPEDAQRLDVFANIDAEVAAAQKYVDKTTQAYQQALSEQGESETPSEKVQYFQALANKANIRLEAAKKNAADPAAREEFARQFWYRIADIDAHISGSIEPGKNVKVELLTTGEMLDKLGEANRKTMSELGGPLPTIPMSAWGPEEINTLSPEQRAYYQRLTFISEAEGASYIRKNTVRKSNGQRVDKNTGEHVVWDPKMEKGTVALNSDVIIKNMIEDGNAFLSVYAHEIGHQLENFDEHKKRTAGLREKLFGTERKDAQGNVIAKTDGIFSDDHLVDLFMQKYGRSNANLTPEEVAENLGLFNRSTGEYDIPGIVSVMRDEVLADFNAVGLYRNYFFNQPKGVAGMVNWLTLKDQNSRVKKLARKLVGLRDEGSAFGERSGAEFTPEAQRLIEQHMRELKSLRGNMAPHNPEESYTPPVAKKDLVANKELSDYYLTDSGRFKTEMAGVVYDADGKVVAEVVLQDPDAKEGAWFHHIDENGRNQISQASGDGEMPPELADLSIPVGGHLMSLVRLARDPSGRPIENSNKETREVVERRSQAIRDAIDNSGDVGAPDRLRPVAPGSNTYRGTLTDAQIEAIRRLPNRVVPYSIKKKLYDINNALKKGDGTRLLLDYATRIDARGRYVPFSPKIQDVVPIGMMFSSDGHFLVTTVSISRMMSKLDRWEAFMPLRLKPWGGSKGSFMEEFVGSYLENHQNGFPGSGFDPATGEVVPGAKPLARDAAEAETKRNIFNDFLNMYDSNTIESNPDRTELPKLKLTREQREDERLVKLAKEQRKAEKSSDQNTMVRSLRLDSIMDLVESDLKKIPVDYYKAKHNLSLDVYEQSRAPRQQQLPSEPESDLLRGMRLNITQAPGGPRFSLLRSDRGPEEAMIERGFYSQMGRTLLDKVPSRATLTQVKNILTGQGVKADEIKWSGIMPYLEMIEKRDGVVTRRDIELFLSDNYKARFFEQEDRVKLPESLWLLTGSGIHESYPTEAEAMAAREDAINEHVEFLQRNESYEVDQTDDGRFFARDSLGRSLREYFDTYQEAEDSITDIFRKEAEREFEVSLDEDAEVESGEYFDYRTKNDNMYADTYREVVLGHPDVKYTSSHYPAYENYVAHMRLQDGVDSKGRPGTLIEELQSDLNQEGRKKGYDVLPNTEGWRAVQSETGPFKAGEKIFYQVYSSNGRILGSVLEEGPEQAIKAVAEMSKEGPPDSPFKKDWALQLFKRALLQAVDSGSKWIGWTEGQAQVDRYNLAKHVDTLAYDTTDGKLIAARAGQRVFDQPVKPENVEKYVGQEIAKKLLETPETANGVKMLFPEDLKIGGEGMKGFYDNILPKELGKYVKQWGGTVEKRRFRSFEPKSQYWHVDITPEMAEGVRRGQALFSLKNTGESGLSESIDATAYDTGRKEENLGLRPDSTRNRRGARTARGYSPLEDAPTVYGIKGGIPKLIDVAEQYAEDRGIPVRRQAEYVKADPERGRRIAEAYEAMPHDPQNPKVKEAYADLIRQTTDQYNALIEAGYKFWFMDPESDPYQGKPWQAMKDLRENESMAVFPTDAGFGSDASFDVANNPLLADTGIKWPSGSPDGPLKAVTANDLFRAVHDAFGHGIEGAGFRAEGEENAWQAHARLFTGPALGALTSETRGQNSWLNFGPYGEKNETASVFDTVFADQKTGLMPEWTWSEGMAPDEPLLTDSKTRGPLEGVRFSLGGAPDTQGAGQPKDLIEGYSISKTPGGKFALIGPKKLLATGKQFATEQEAKDASHYLAAANEPLLQTPYRLVEGRTGKYKIVDKKGGQAASKTFSNPKEAADYAVAMYRENMPLSQVKKVMKKADRDAITAAEERIASVQAQYPESVPLDVARDEKTGLPKIDLLEDADENPILDENGKQMRGVIYKKVPYELRKSPKLDQKDDAKAVQQAADLMEPEVHLALTVPSISKAIGWYGNMRADLQRGLGANIELFGQLLGATSARTPVDENFKQTREAAIQYSKGAYDDLLDRFHQHILSAKEKVESENPDLSDGEKADLIRKEVNKFPEVPLRPNGKKFNANSQKVLHALYGNWLEQTVGPKTPNFAGNLTGRTLDATIDVWAARNMRRLLYDTGGNQWRLLPEQEQGVQSAYNKQGELVGDFPFAQEVYRELQRRVGMNPDDLQALNWFYEKDVWDKMGWTGAVGAKKSSFEEEAAKVVWDRYQAGVTAFTSSDQYPDLDVFKANEQEQLRKALRSSIAGLNGLEISRVTQTVGLYGGSIEPSLDIEFSVARDKNGNSRSIKPFIETAIQQAAANNQYDVFVSQVVDVNHPNARPMVEVGFKSSATPEQVESITSAFRAAGIDGFTVAADRRGNVIGIRAQYVPEMAARWDTDLRDAYLDPAQHGKNSNNWMAKAQSVLNNIAASENVSYAQEGYVATIVYGKEEYNRSTTPDNLSGSSAATELGRRKQILSSPKKSGQVSGWDNPKPATQPADAGLGEAAPTRGAP